MIIRKKAGEITACNNPIQPSYIGSDAADFGMVRMDQHSVPYSFNQEKT